MTELELLTQHAIRTPHLNALLKSAQTDQQFIEILVREANAVGYLVDAETIHAQMTADRQASRCMDEQEFEDTAGSMLGARLSGGHNSGKSC